MPGYIPPRDPEFDAWFANFQQYTAAHAAELGLTPAQALEIQTAKAAWWAVDTGRGVLI
jgi:imidazolonepropionase-like amidohydrolase